jgi:hypothetical protein
VVLTIEPWTDTAFVRAVEDAWKQVVLRGSDVASGRGAAIAQVILREAGYPNSCVVDRRTYQDVLEHLARWQVFRDRPE